MDPRINFVFLHVGEDIRPLLLVKSIRKFYPNANIYQCSDLKTSQIDGVDFMYRHDGNIENLMIFRLEAFSNLKLNERSIYLDTDMLVTNFFDLSTFDKYDIILCKRSFANNALINTTFKGMDLSEYQEKTLGEVYPFLACFNITNSYLFWSECLKALRSIDKKFFFWYGDQEAIRIVATLNYDFNIGTLDESEFACLPEYVNKDNLPYLIHYKGPNRKGLMIEDAKKYTL